MKKLAMLAVLLLFLGGCKWIKETTVETCDAIDTVQSGVSDVGEFFGAPGNVVAGTVNMLLQLTCGIIGTTGAIPQNLTDLVTGDEPDAEVADVDTDPGDPDG